MAVQVETGSVGEGNGTQDGAGAKTAARKRIRARAMTRVRKTSQGGSAGMRAVVWKMTRARAGWRRRLHNGEDARDGIGG